MAEQDENLDVILSKLLKVAIRRRWWLLVPVFVLAMSACVVAMLIPNSYRSEATILVEQQRVPER